MSKIKITIDPGHYEGYNKGANGTYYEGTRVFELARYLKTELENKGIFEVYLTKSKVSDNPSLATRGKTAIKNGSKLFISLHSDAFSNSSACGTSVFYSIKRPNSKTLAQNLGNAVASYMNTKTGVSYFRGAKTNVSGGLDYYGVIRNAVSSGNVENVFIIEHGFHTNSKECAFLDNSDNLKALAKTEANIIYNYYKGDVIDSTANVEKYEVYNTIKGYRNASDAMSGNNAVSDIPVGIYYLYRSYSNGAVNITTDNTASTPGWWINPNTNIKPITVEMYEVYKEIDGYKTAADAMANENPATNISVGSYYIYRTYSNGAINITSDSSGKNPGSWINPNDNIKETVTIPEKTPEELLSEIDTSDLTAISMGYKNQPEITADQAVRYVKSKTSEYKLTCELEHLVYAFMRAGFIENIRWDVAFAQAIKETGYFRYGGQVEWDQNNFAGIGATNDGASGNGFKDAFTGALAQMQHLKAYANTDPVYTTLFDARFNYVTRGWAPYLEWLGMEDNPKNKIYDKSLGWAVPGKGYGASIRNILDEMKKM